MNSFGIAFSILLSTAQVLSAVLLFTGCGPEKTIEDSNSAQNRVRADEDKRIAKTRFSETYRPLIGTFDGRWRGLTGGWYTARLVLREDSVIKKIGGEVYSVPSPGGYLVVLLNAKKTPGDATAEDWYDLGSVIDGGWTKETGEVFLTFGALPDDRTGTSSGRVFKGTFDGSVLQGDLPINRGSSRLELRKVR